MLNKTIKLIIATTILLIPNFVCQQNTDAKESKTESYEKKLRLTNLNNINITNELAKNKNKTEELIKNKRPKALYLEQWILLEPNNKNLLRNLSKLTKKYQTKLYLIVGRNTWFGKRGASNTVEAFDTYGEYVDGIVLRILPNKTNVWKDDNAIRAQVLNQMLDAYYAIYLKAKKRNKSFIVEYPFWLSDFKGPLKSFSENTCDYADRIIFIIDNAEMLDKIATKWNDVTCSYGINLTKRATMQNEELIKELYKKLNSKLTLYANFIGYIIDSDSTLTDSD